jgi:hypothetical protein
MRVEFANPPNELIIGLFGRRKGFFEVALGDEQALTIGSRFPADINASLPVSA